MVASGLRLRRLSIVACASATVFPTRAFARAFPAIATRMGHIAPAIEGAEPKPRGPSRDERLDHCVVAQIGSKRSW
jgi:hypothetical protein